MALIDRFGRKHDYLRISVTDRCNLRCVYCMPPEGVPFVPHSEILSYEQITEVVRVGAKLGIRRLRLTGGEPLVRKDIEKLVAQLAAIEGIEDIALTTNGIFLAKKAQALKDAGVTRINLSLDTMDPEKFAMVTRGGDVKRVLDALHTSIAVGFSPIKLNVVLMKGVNDNEVADFLKLSMEHPIQVRFIEYMPIGHENDEWRTKYLPLTYVHTICDQLGVPYGPTDLVYGNGPAENFRFEGAKGSFGLIHPVSEHFCSNCNRLRLTADGFLKPCLYWDEELNVKRALGDEEALTQLFNKALEVKPENHEMANALNHETKSHKPTTRRMSQIGG